MAGPYLFANNVSTTLSAAATSSQTTLTLSSVAGIPTSIPTGTYFALTLNDAATRLVFEVVYVTQPPSGSTVTVIRGQDGTSAVAWNVGDYCYGAVTGGELASFGQLSKTQTWTGANTFDQPVALPAATSSGDAVNLSQFSSAPSANGFKKYPDANSPTGYLIEQWGAAGGTSLTINVTFPIPFPTAVLRVLVTSESAAVSGNWGVGLPTLGALVSGSQTTTGFTMYLLFWTGSGWSGATSSEAVTPGWWAIGY